MKILTFNEQNDLSLSMTSVDPVVKHVLSAEKARPDEVAIYFVSEEEITKLHGEFFDDPTSTDCISFPIDQSFLGEVFVCPKVASDRIMKQGEELTDTPYQETTLYLVHGLLHLLGYEDTDDTSRAKMEKRQSEILQDLIEKNVLLYA